MIESYVITRLESMVERLNSVLEQNLFSEYKKDPVRISNRGKAIYQLLKLEPILRKLTQARTARSLILSAGNHPNSKSSMREYLHAAAIVYTVLCDFSDSQRVYCGVDVDVALNKSLKKAMNNTTLHKEAEEVYNFINFKAPVYSWSYDDHTDNNGYKIFELVKSEQEFTELIEDDEYTEITGSGMTGIRIAFKRGHPRIILPLEKKAKEEELRKAVGNDFYAQYGNKAAEIMYPSTCYSCYYKIYVPTN